jgi:hypothetical protein
VVLGLQARGAEAPELRLREGGLLGLAFADRDVKERVALLRVAALWGLAYTPVGARLPASRSRPDRTAFPAKV